MGTRNVGDPRTRGTFFYQLLLRKKIFGVFAAFAIFFVGFGPQTALSQTASFAFGHGGFVYTDRGQQGLFSECAAMVEEYGIGVCDGHTHLKGAWSNTLTEAYTKSGTGYGGTSTSSAGAAATYNLNGFGSTVTHCALSQGGGSSSCGAGAYASPDGAFAATTLTSTR